MAGHPLALAKAELATLLRLVEAVMAPGWAHRDGRVTRAGLVGTRTGRGAATDRLALLLLVLEARERGWVRLCGGAVDTRRGRAAATVARLLGCTASRGERLSGWQQDEVEAAAKTELARLEGLLTQQGGAPPLLAGRLADRLQETGGEALVTGPYGWLIRRPTPVSWPFSSWRAAFRATRPISVLTLG